MRRIRALVVAIVLLAAVVTPASAKGPGFYGSLTVRVIGAGGSERSFDGNAGPDSEQAWLLTQKVAEAMVRVQTDPDPAGGHSYYQVAFSQADDVASWKRLPWYGMPTARFFYYPAAARGTGRLRVVAAHISQTPRESWVATDPATDELLRRHSGGLTAIAPATSRELSPWPLAVALGVAVVLVVAVLAGLSRRLPLRPTLAESP